jgi:iron complex outermembrane receptor protein
MAQIEESRRFNQDGLHTDSTGKTVRYNNETDNYRSHILQAFYVFNLSENWTFNSGFNYTNGYGFTETYRTRRNFINDFGFPNQTVGGTTHTRSDVVRQMFMSNHFYATNVNFLYAKNNLNVNIG